MISELAEEDPLVAFIKYMQNSVNTWKNQLLDVSFKN